MELTVHAGRSLTRVERACGTRKMADVQVRPTNHRLAGTVLAPLFLCLLAYFVEGHTRDAPRRRLFQRVRSARQRRGRPGQRRARAYLRVARRLVRRAEWTLGELAALQVPGAVREEIEGYVQHAWRQVGQIDRRVLQGETIPHAEKVFSIFSSTRAGA